MSVADPVPPQLARHEWLGLARRARMLSWLSLGYMTVEGAVAIMAASPAALLVGLVGNAALGLWWLDPVAALVIAAVAIREGFETWRGEGCCAPSADPDSHTVEGGVDCCEAAPQV